MDAARKQEIESEERLRAQVREKINEEQNGWKKPILIICFIMVVIGMALQIFSGGKSNFLP